MSERPDDTEPFSDDGEVPCSVEDVPGDDGEMPEDAEFPEDEDPKH